MQAAKWCSADLGKATSQAKDGWSFNQRVSNSGYLDPFSMIDDAEKQIDEADHEIS